MTTVVTRGAASAQALGYASSSAAVNYIEDVFSTYLYTGNGSTQTITNGIDLSTKGGMVWLKSRSAATDNFLFDTTRGTLNEINSNTTDAQASLAASLTAFNTTGFSLGAAAGINVNAETYASWTFREQPKFFDVVTYTGTGANRTIAHNLGSVPGLIIVKRTNAVDDWQCYHRSLANTQYILLNTTGSAATGATRWNSTTPTSSVFSLGTDASVNASGGTYVAYLFAHNAGGFGLTGTDNVISCGSYTGNGSITGPIITLDYEPQWVLIKNTTTGQSWWLFDNMRGMSLSSDEGLNPNTSGAATTLDWVSPTATGFQIVTSSGGANTSGENYIYMAIRRGPMKVPTDATKVFTPATRTGTGADIVLTSAGFPVDLAMLAARSGTYSATVATYDRLRGATQYIRTAGTNAEATVAAGLTSFSSMNGVSLGAGGAGNVGAEPYVDWYFRRAPGFFDEVCYTGTGANTTQTHNLAAIPELMLVKGRSGATAWQVYSSALASTEYLVLNTTAAKATGATRWNSTRPTSSVFSLGSAAEVNTSLDTYVAYLFATCPGVSKVGSYTGTGTTLQINCGFTAGSRFVLIKRTDSTGDWYVWDSARGIIPANDPYLLLNSTAAEVTGTDYVDTYSAGFEISSTAPAAINANGGTFIFLAIA